MRKAWIPETWITSGVNGETLRTLVTIALHADKNGMSFIKNEVLCSMLNKETRQIQLDLKRGESLGLISRKYTEQGKRYFVISMNESTGATALRPAQSDDMVNQCAQRNDVARGGAMALRGVAQSDCAPPNNPLIGTLYSSTVSLHTNTNAGGREAEKPQAPDTECVSFSGETSLPQGTPKTEIPEDIKRMSSQLQLESWIGELQFQGESLEDWRVRETLGVIFAQGGKKGSRYAWGIYRNLPKERPAATDVIQKNKVNDEERKARNLARLEALK